MSDQTVTELVIDADTSGADRFSQAMDKAGESAEKSTNAAQSAGLAIAGVGVASLAAFAAINKGLNYVVGLNKELADMATMAKQVGLSLADIQGIKLGAGVAGLDDKTINAGLEKSAALLNDASRNANSLSKELAANGLSVKNANGQLITQNQLLGIAADLVKRAQTPGDAKAIAEMLGFSKEWIPLLRQGADAMAGLSDEARKAGAVIDDETINRATEFDRQWRKSSVEFQAYMKSALVSLLPLVDDLIQRSAEFVKSLDVNKIEAAAKGQLNDLARPLGLPDTDESVSVGVKMEITPEARQAVEDIKNSTSLWEGFVKTLGLFAANKPLTNNTVFGPEQAKWIAGTGREFDDTSSTNLTDKIRSQNTAATWIAQGTAYKQFADAVRSGSEFAAGGFSKVAAKGTEANDTVDRAIDTLQRHIERQKADALAVGLGDGALARFRAEAAETASVLANGGKETDEQRAKFAKLKDEAFATADALAKAKVASQIDFSNKTKFLSADDVAIATQLKGIYGNDVPKALASTEAAQLRVISAQKMLSDGFQDVGKAMFSAFLSGKNVMDAMVQSLDNIAKKLSDKAFENILSGVLSGNLVQAGIGVAQAGASALISAFTGDQKAKKALQEAQEAWAKMSGQVEQFNAAAAGFDMGPLTNELNSMLGTVNDLIAAAVKAKDLSGAAKLTDSFYAATTRIYLEFQRGGDVLTPLQQSMKELNDEAYGLKQSFSDIGLTDFASNIDGLVKDRMQKLLAAFNDTFVAGLTARLNTAQGKSYLNDAATLLAQRQKDLADAATLGNSPTLLAQISAVFHAEAQKIVDDAGLVGDAFTDFTRQFPSLADVVVQANADMTASAKQLQDAANTTAKSITDYVNGLNAGSSSTLSPQAQLAAAQAAYNTKLILAQGGNADAQSSITTSAQSLLDAARAVYASSTTYQSYFQAITSQLLNLPAVQNATDPVVTAMRDVLTAVNTGNLIQSAQILPAVNAGNATSVANALAAYFNQIDPSGRLASIVTGTSATATQTAQIASLQTAENSLSTTANSLASTQNTLLNSINSLQSTATTQLSLLQANLTPQAVLGQGVPTLTRQGSFAQTLTVSNGMLEALNKIVFNTYAIAWMIGHPSPNGKNLDSGIDPVYAQGGWITGGTPGRDSVSILAMPDEYMINANATRALTQRYGRGVMDVINSGRLPAGPRNDNFPTIASVRGGGNADLVAEVRALRQEVAQLRQENNKGNTGIAVAVGQHAQFTGGKLDDVVKSNDRQTSEVRLKRRDQRAS